MVNYSPEIKVVLDTMLLGIPGVQSGKMFGFPAYYVGKKLGICLYEEGVGVKLPADSVKRLLESDPHTIPFQPYGKAVMREWVQINLPESEDYLKYQSIFDESIQYLLTLENRVKTHG
jgi:hypothetical protein